MDKQVTVPLPCQLYSQHSSPHAHAISFTLFFLSWLFFIFFRSCRTYAVSCLMVGEIYLIASGSALSFDSSSLSSCSRAKSSRLL